MSIVCNEIKEAPGTLKDREKELSLLKAEYQYIQRKIDILKSLPDTCFFAIDDWLCSLGLEADSVLLVSAWIDGFIESNKFPGITVEKDGVYCLSESCKENLNAVLGPYIIPEKSPKTK